MDLQIKLLREAVHSSSLGNIKSISGCLSKQKSSSTATGS